MATLNQGASIELLSVGSISESVAMGKYWAKKLAHGSKVRQISLQSVNKGWKITIKYNAKETAQ